MENENIVDFDSIMNKPIDCEFADQDIVEEYNRIKDKKRVSSIYNISVSEVTKILKIADKK